MTDQRKGTALEVAIGAAAIIAAGGLLMLFSGFGIVVVLFGVLGLLGSFFSGKKPPAPNKKPRKTTPAMSDWAYWGHR